MLAQVRVGPHTLKCLKKSAVRLPLLLEAAISPAGTSRQNVPQQLLHQRAGASASNECENSLNHRPAPWPEVVSELQQPAQQVAWISRRALPTPYSGLLASGKSGEQKLQGILPQARTV